MQTQAEYILSQRKGNRIFRIHLLFDFEVTTFRFSSSSNYDIIFSYTTDKICSVVSHIDDCCQLSEMLMTTY